MALPAIELLFVACNGSSCGSGLLFTETGSEDVCGAFVSDPPPTGIASWFAMAAREISALLRCGDGCGDDRGGCGGEGNGKARPEADAPAASACGMSPTASWRVVQ